MERAGRVAGRERAGPAAELGRRIVALARVARDFGEILEGAARDGPGAVERIARAQIELERAVARILEAERAWNEWNDGTGREGGRAGGRSGDGGDIDFDAARHEIGCRLARLRECCRPD